jgi:tetratricopeptide (TPR) repeat protein
LASIFNPDEPLYRIDMGYAAAASAAALSADESSESAELIEKLEKIAVSETEKVLLDYPQNVSNFRSAVRTYYELATIDPIYLDKVIVTFDQAIALAPTDPKLYFNKGLIENQMGKKSATQTIEKAISLKPNYRDAYLGLATILIQNKEIPEAKIWLERAAKYYPNDKEIEDKLSQL